MKWLPWRFVIRHVARNQGFLDHIALLSKLHGFAQPSAVGEPIELLRVGVVFHARGLLTPMLDGWSLDGWLIDGDGRCLLPSRTGQWPEAIHPRTGGGCMGDGHHVWAAAEWRLMLRNCFVREEGDGLILCAGIPPRWLEQDDPIRFGPALTSSGTITLTISPQAGTPPRVEWQADWHGTAAPIQVCLPGFEAAAVGADSIDLVRKES